MGAGLGTALSTALSIAAHAIESTQQASQFIAALLDGYESAPLRDVCFTPKADIAEHDGNVRFVPKADIASL